MVSIVVPTFNDVKNNLSLFAYMERLATHPNVEVIVVDSQSQDESWEKIPSSCQKYSIANPTRAERINVGIKHSHHPMILVHHPRSRLTEKALHELLQISGDQVWGGFTHSFDQEHPVLKFTSWYSNKVRLKIRKIVYLDHCLFFHRKLLPENYSIKPVDIFEDTLISLELKKLASPIRLSQLSQTSSQRFMKNGIIRQCLLNATMKIGFYLKLSPERMNKIYEKGLSLNTSYDKKTKSVTDKGK